MHGFGIMSAHGKRGGFLIAAVIYFLAASLLHEQVSNVYSAIFHHFGRAVMERSLHVISLAGFAAALVMSWKAVLRRGRGFFVSAPLWILSLAIVIAADALLVVTNVERIHYPQYAILALLLVPVLPSYFTVLVVCAAAGGVDEFLQYAMFPHYTEYLDFNDFVLNLGGAGLGLALHASFAKASALRVMRLKAMDAKAALAALTVTLVLFGAGAAGLIVHQAPVKDGYRLVQQVDGRPALVLSFRRPDGFWTQAGHGKTYHILAPLPGTLVLAGVLGLYAGVLALASAGQGRETALYAPETPNQEEL